MRVLTAIEARSSSTVWPRSVWYRPAASAAAVTKAALSVPPRRVAASLVEANGTRAVSMRRRIERSVHSGDRAESVSDSCDTTLRSVSTAATVAWGIDVGSASSSRT